MSRKAARRPLLAAAFALAAVLAPLALPVEAVSPEIAPPTYRIRLPKGNGADTLRGVLAGAHSRLGDPMCQAVFSEFRDPSGRPLRDVLDALGETPQSYLGLVLFYDGGGKPFCSDRYIVAVTSPGSRLVYICPDGFRDRVRRDPRWTEIAIIHEVLHTILPLAGGIPKGEPWRLTNDSVWVFGLAWTPDSREIVFDSARGGRRSLWRITPAPGAEPRRVPGTDDGRYPTISRGPQVRLAYQRFDPDPNIWRMEIPPSPTVNTPPTRIIASTAWERDPQFSPDGARIAFVSERSGYAEIWLAGADGSSPVQLTSFSGARTAGAPSWSPDGRQLVFDSMAGGDFDIFVIDLESRVSRQLTADGSFNVRPSWSRDGRRLYFGSRKGGTHQVWKIPAEGGSAEQVTKGGGVEAVEAPGGKFLYYTRSFGVTPGLWQVPVDGGVEVPVIDSAWTGHWAVTDRRIYFVDFSGVPAAAPKPVRFFGFEDRRVTRAGIIERIRLGDNNASFSVSRDGRWAIWRQDDRPESNIMLIDDFR